MVRLQSNGRALIHQVAQAVLRRSVGGKPGNVTQLPRVTGARRRGGHPNALGFAGQVSDGNCQGFFLTRFQH